MSRHPIIFFYKGDIMKAIHVVLMLMMICVSLIQAQNKDPKEILKDPKARSEIFSTIIGEHDLMKEFLELAKDNEHAKMMVSHIMGDQPAETDHANCPMKDSPATSSTKSPYAGEETRGIKSLSLEDIQKYRDGEGMGMAKAAELNHYPGPKHVLQIASDLKLSKEQQGKAQQLYNAMHAKAVRLGKTFVDKEEQLNNSFAGGTIDQLKLAGMLKELGRLQGELRLAHLEAHVQMKTLLSTDQRARYDSLRGYMHSGLNHQH